MKILFTSIAVFFLSLATFRLATAGTSIANPGPVGRPTGGGGGGGTNPGLTNLVAWYDFTSSADADGGTYNLTEVGTPPPISYTAGPPSYGTASATLAQYWSQGALDDNYNSVTGSWSFAVRFRGYTSMTNGDTVLYANGGRTRIEWQDTAGMAVSLGRTLSSATPAALNTWYTVVVTLTESGGTGVAQVSVNGATYIASTSGAVSFATGIFRFGAHSSATPKYNVEFDFAGFWNKALTQAEATWLYNSGGTRTYSEL